MELPAISQPPSHVPYQFFLVRRKVGYRLYKPQSLTLSKSTPQLNTSGLKCTLLPPLKVRGTQARRPPGLSRLAFFRKKRKMQSHLAVPPDSFRPWSPL